MSIKSLAFAASMSAALTLLTPILAARPPIEEQPWPDAAAQLYNWSHHVSSAILRHSGMAMNQVVEGQPAISYLESIGLKPSDALLFIIYREGDPIGAGDLIVYHESALALDRFTGKMETRFGLTARVAKSVDNSSVLTEDDLVVGFDRVEGIVTRIIRPRDGGSNNGGANPRIDKIGIKAENKP